ncbi:hypothetical protein C8J56DRAFT_890086 [Mycena floridula]|nr:hypothetical protein C8J56DRAFT_890086 [Mycena floridula]
MAQVLNMAPQVTVSEINLSSAFKVNFNFHLNNSLRKFAFTTGGQGFYHRVTILGTTSGHRVIRGLKKRFKETGVKPEFIHMSGTGCTGDGAEGMFSSDVIYNDMDIAQIESLKPTQSHRDVDLAIVEADTQVLPGAVYGAIILGEGKNITTSVDVNEINGDATFDEIASIIEDKAVPRRPVTQAELAQYYPGHVIINRFFGDNCHAVAKRARAMG